MGKMKLFKALTNRKVIDKVVCPKCRYDVFKAVSVLFRQEETLAFRCDSCKVLYALPHPRNKLKQKLIDIEYNLLTDITNKYLYPDKSQRQKKRYYRVSASYKKLKELINSRFEKERRGV